MTDLVEILNNNKRRVWHTCVLQHQISARQDKIDKMDDKEFETIQ